MQKKIKLVLTASAAMLLLSCIVVILCVVFAPAKQAALSLSVSPLTLSVSTSKSLNVNCNSTEAQMKFEVYDESIVVVDNLVVTALKVGSTSIRITATRGEDKISAVAQVTVTENLEGPIVDLPSSVSLYLLDKNIEAAKADGFFNETNFVAFRSYTTSISSNIVKVTKNAIIAQKEGCATVTFASTNSKVTNVVNVEVKKIPPEITDLPSEVSLEPDEEFNLKYSIEPVYYSGDAELKFNCVDPNVEIVGNKITAKSSGEASVSVELNKKIIKTVKISVSAPVKIILAPISNCEKVEGGLKVHGANARFSFHLYDLEDGTLNISELKIVSQNLPFKRELNAIVLLSAQEGKLVFYNENLNFRFTLRIFV